MKKLYYIIASLLTIAFLSSCSEVLDKAEVDAQYADPSRIGTATIESVTQQDDLGLVVRATGSVSSAADSILEVGVLVCDNAELIGGSAHTIDKSLLAEDGSFSLDYMPILGAKNYVQIYVINAWGTGRSEVMTIDIPMPSNKELVNNRNYTMYATDYSSDSDVSYTYNVSIDETNENIVWFTNLTDCGQTFFGEANYETGEITIPCGQTGAYGQYKLVLGMFDESNIYSGGTMTATISVDSNVTMSFGNECGFAALAFSGSEYLGYLVMYYPGQYGVLQ